ncbi:uncharacterized protein LOC142589892 [Dermacentor variabilis]|uniref:uncharacterized protein LOC142589892 n=1 Tax=Dermacentor variabilis TaxID=34621 RepID=UPI003F5B1BB4
MAFNAVIGRHALRGVPLDAAELRRLMLAHTDLGSAVRGLDADFSPSAFLWVCLFVLGVCVEVSHFLGHRRAGDRYELVIFAQNLGSVTLAFFLLSVIASRLTEAAHASSVPLHRCLGHAPTSPDSTTTTATAEVGATMAPPLLEGRLLASQLRAPVVELTGWGFFAFSRSFVLTLAGALISYVVIILQLNPATSGGGVPDH